jgi:hypothetical protein
MTALHAAASCISINGLSVSILLGTEKIDGIQGINKWPARMEGRTKAAGNACLSVSVVSDSIYPQSLNICKYPSFIITDAAIEIPLDSFTNIVENWDGLDIPITNILMYLRISAGHPVFPSGDSNVRKLFPNRASTHRNHQLANHDLRFALSRSKQPDITSSDLGAVMSMNRRHTDLASLSTAHFRQYVRGFR